MTVEKRYANAYVNNLWLTPANALGVEDNSCSSTASVDVLNKLDVTFGFSLPAGAVITQVLVDCKIAISAGNYLSVKLGDGIAFLLLGDIDGAGRPICFNTAYLGAKNVTAFLDTAAKVNAALIRFHHVAGANGIPWTAYVDACWIQVTYTAPALDPLFMGINI